MSASHHSFRLEAVSAAKGSHFGGSVRTDVSKGKKKITFTAVDPRIESSKVVLTALESVIRADAAASGPPLDDIPAPVYFAVIVSTLRSGDKGHTDEVSKPFDSFNWQRSPLLVMFLVHHASTRSCCTCCRQLLPLCHKGRCTTTTIS